MNLKGRSFLTLLDFTPEEALGLSFALLFGLAGDEQAKRVVQSAVTTKNGIPCLHPGFSRYDALGLGRHSGTVWPHAQAFWADAAAPYDPGALNHELTALTKNALREGFFSEIYHPETGLPYGGIQESGGHPHANWQSQPRQTWSATGYIRMVLFGLMGLSIGEDRVTLSPRNIDAVKRLKLSGLRWRDMTLDIEIGAGGFSGKTAEARHQAGERVHISL